MTAPHLEHRRALAGLLLANLFWGLSFPLIKSVVHLHALLLPGSGNWFITALTVAPRFLLAALVLAVVVHRQLAGLTAAELVARGTSPVVECFDAVDADFVRAVGKQLAAHPGLVAVLGARGAEGTHVLVVRGAGATTDCGALWKKLAAACGGRGGGNAERAEGRLPADVDWSKIVAVAQPD